MQKDITKIQSFSEEKKKYYNLLMHYRELVTSQMKHHVEDALNSDNNDKKGVTTHMAELGSDNSRHDMELQMLTGDGDVLKLIEDAIERLFDDEFGFCIDCGMKIPEARLEVRPYALYCTKCKTIREKNMV